MHVMQGDYSGEVPRAGTGAGTSDHLLARGVSTTGPNAGSKFKQAPLRAKAWETSPLSGS